MGTAKFAVFVDLENCGAKVDTLSNILEKVKIRGDILLGKVYGYSDRFSDLKEILLSNTFTVVPSLRYGAAQKNNADIMLVIDALTTAFSNPLIDSFCIVSGDSDYVPLVGTSFWASAAVRLPAIFSLMPATNSNFLKLSAYPPAVPYAPKTGAVPLKPNLMMKMLCAS